MAHGTGYYLNRVYDADMNKDEYAVIVLKEVYYYFPAMSDSYEPDCEATGKYKIEISKWRTDRLGHMIADEFSDHAGTGLIDRETARMIYWNLKDRNISYETAERLFQNI